MDGFIYDRIRDLDAHVVEAGFGGIYALHKLRNEQGLDVVAEIAAAGVAAGHPNFVTKSPPFSLGAAHVGRPSRPVRAVTQR